LNKILKDLLITKILSEGLQNIFQISLKNVVEVEYKIMLSFTISIQSYMKKKHIYYLPLLLLIQTERKKRNRNLKIDLAKKLSCSSQFFGG